MPEILGPFWLIYSLCFDNIILSSSTAEMIQQGLELADKPHVVIATPGRLADHIESGTNFSLKRIRFLVCTRSI